jgi:hypothetical protein
MRNMFCRKKVVYHLVNSNREIIKSDVEFKITPRKDEYIYFNDNGPFYKVINLSHQVNNNQNIWIIIEKII